MRNVLLRATPSTSIAMLILLIFQMKAYLADPSAFAAAAPAASDEKKDDAAPAAQEEEEEESDDDMGFDLFGD